MRIKIKHPTEWAAATMLRRGLATGIVIFAFLYFAPLEEIFCSGGGEFCPKAVSFGAFLAFAAALFLIVVPVYILYRNGTSGAKMARTLRPWSLPPRA